MFIYTCAIITVHTFHKLLLASSVTNVIDYCKPEILAKDSNVFRLCVKETLKIQDYYAHKSLNENTGSFKLALW